MMVDREGRTMACGTLIDSRVYTAALFNCDNEIGHVLDAIQELGELDNTLAIYIQGDNGRAPKVVRKVCSMKWLSSTPLRKTLKR
jgi:arylsulfatase A-like enzyme